MANDDHVALLKQGVDAWHAWRRANPHIRPDLGGANLRGWDLRTMDLSNACLIDTDLSSALLSDVVFTGAICSSITDLSSARLVRAKLGGVDLSGANLIDANLNRAILNRTVLRGARLVGTRFFKADLSRADLRGADLWAATLVDTDLTGADLTGARVHGVSAWRVTLDKNTKQRDLIITDVDEPTVTVDKIEVAQLVYLLLHNDKIRDVIDTVGKKGVLILGRFTPERKEVLHALREELRKRDYVPILFDFDKPASRDLTATVSTLAHLARFIIADLTDPSSIPYELATVVPTTPVPVQPILLSGSSEFAMFKDLRRRHHWVLTTHRYDNQEQLIADLGEKVIRPAELKVLDLQGST
jgi:Pentapeptide repeats (8 copies)